MSGKVTDLFTSQNPTTKMTMVLNIGTTLNLLDELYKALVAEMDSRESSEDDTLRELEAAKAALELKRVYSLLLEDQNDVKRLYAKIHETRKEFGRGFSKLHAEIHREDKKIYDDLAGRIIELHEELIEKITELREDIFNDPTNGIVFVDGRSDVDGRQEITHVKTVETPPL